MSNSAISIEDLGKRYRVGRQLAKGDGLRHAMEAALRSPVAWIRKRREQSSKEEDFWALRNISATIQEGDVVGVLGRNGAGKSTLLKLLSRITVPTEGRIKLQGRVASLLEVGTGFHQELTGRENIFLNGAILGMARAEIIRKFDEIVAFSEIEQFIDTPVKRYSSGMYVRLAFAVAAHLDPEILIVDEVLAVGDTAFQRKCLGKMGSFAASGRTILFVSHNIEAIRTLCRRGIWLKAGGLMMDGEISSVADEYTKSLFSEEVPSWDNPDYGICLNKLALKNGRGEQTNHFAPGEDLRVEISFQARKRVNRPRFAIGIVGANGSCFTSNMLLDGKFPEYLEGEGTLTCVFKAIPLLPQTYTVKMAVRDETIKDFIFPYKDVTSFNVTGNLAEYGYEGEYVHWASRSTPVVIPYEWHLPDGRRRAVSLSQTASTSPNDPRRVQESTLELDAMQ